MKLHHVAFAACAALSTQAFALDAATTAAPATIKLYISGSSALQSVIEGLLRQNCQGATTTSTAAIEGTFTRYTSAEGNAYSCTTLATGSDFGTAFDNKNVAIIKRDSGGSAFGVFPLASPTSAAPTATVQFIDLATCADSTLTCTGLTPTSGVGSVVPDAGVSDLEPVAFNNPVNQPTAFAGQTVTAGGFRSSTSVAEQVFALVVNDNLYNDLVAIQGTATPSVPKAAFASIFGQGYDAFTLGWSPFGKTLPSKTSQVNLCSRGIGSGTRATAQVYFLNLPYNSLSVSAAAAQAGDGVQGGTTAGQFRLTEESSSGNVVNCVKAANATGGYSIGIVGADRDLTGTGTHFVSIDNVAPGRAAAKEGQYQWTFESFYNVSKKAASTSTNLFVNAFGVAFRKPANINAVSAASQNGLMATPSNCSGATASDWVLPEEVAACSRVSRNRDSRQPLTFAK